MLPYPIAARRLLEVYGVVPLCLLVVAGDYFWGQGRIRSLLPNDWSMRHFVWIAFYINYPHLAANIYSFFDRRYLAFYKNQLLITLAITGFLVFLLQPRISPVLVSVIFWVVTAFHVVMQQIGVTRILGFHKGLGFEAWKWLIVLGQMLTHLLLVLRLDLVNRYVPAVSLRQLGNAALVVFAVLIVAVSAASHFKIHAAKARAAMWFNSVMLLLMMGLYFVGYGFFSIFMVTTVHNLTAFLFYIRHDMNRNHAASPNFSYRPLRALGFPVWAQSLIWSLVLGYLGIRYAGENAGVLAVSFISYFHYISDGYAWKRGSLHRQFTSVTV